MGLRCACAAVPLFHCGTGHQGLSPLEVLTFCSATWSTDSVWLEISKGFMLQMVLSCKWFYAANGSGRGGSGAEPRVLMTAHPPLPGVRGLLIMRKLSAQGPLGCHVFLSVWL